MTFKKNKQYFKFSLYGFLKNLRFYEAFLLLFLIDNNISYTHIGILYASKEITSFAFEIPSGLIADTYGRKNALILSFALYILSFILFYLSTSFLIFWLAMVLFGIADAFRSGAHKGMIMDYLSINNWGEYKTHYYGNTRAWSQRGSAISSLAAGIIVFYSGEYRTIYLLSIIPYLLNFINIYTYPKELNHSSNKDSTNSASFKKILENSFTQLKNRKVLRVVNSSALHSAFLKSIKDYIQPLMLYVALLIPILSSMEEKNRTGLTIGIIYFLIFLLTAYASSIAGKFSDKFKTNVESRTLLFGLFAGVLCGLLFHLGFGLIALFSFIAIYFIENLRKPILTSILTENVTNEILTSVISAQAFYKTLITSILSILIGVIADLQGVGLGIFYVSMVLIVFTMAIDRRKKA